MADHALDQAWALKAACYEAWHTAPRDAQASADAIQALVEALPTQDAETADAATLRALADWTAGIAHLADGRLADALTRLEAAQAGFDRQGDAQHAAEAQVPQVVALAMLGRDAQALERAESALAQFVASGDERSAGKIEINLGTMLSRQDRHTEAEARFRGAAVRFARTGDVEHSISADIALANTLMWKLEFDEALRVNERARTRARTHRYAVLGADAQQAIGHIELHRGRRHRALRELAEGSRLLAAAGAPPQRCLEAESALADAYLAVNLLDEAVALYTRVLDAAQALQAPAEAARALLHRAQAHGRRGHHAQAIEGFEQARGRFAELDNPATVAWCDLCLGELALVMGQADEARRLAARAAPVLLAHGITGWWLQARVLQAQADAASGRGQAAQSEFEAVLGEAGAARLSQLALPCHTGLGALALRAGNLAGARTALEAALQLVDAARLALPDDTLRSAVAADGGAAHALLVEQALALGDPARLLADLERGRARALALSLRDTTPRPAPAPASTRLQWLREQWRQALADGDRLRVPELARQVQAQEYELLEAHRRELLSQPAVAPANASPSTPTEPAALLAALQQALPAGTALLSYYLHGDQLLACVVNHSHIAHRVLAALQLPGRLQSLRFQIDSLRARGPAMQRHGPLLLARAQAHLQALHALVWAPLLPLLQGSARVVVVPHRELHYLPFAALHDGRQSLAETHELLLAPSASVWLQQQSRAAPRYERVLALGAGASALPHVVREVEAVTAAAGAGARALLGEAASRAAWLAAAPEADVLHLACHGRFRADNPAFSMLQLADGPLSLHELGALRLQASLVVLSACETGQSRVAPGDEVLGLVRAFMLAGAGSVLATLWQVDDAATADLMADFYGRLRAGACAAAALQQAQATRAAAGQHPFYWAGFVLHGRA